MFGVGVGVDISTDQRVRTSNEQTENLQFRYWVWQAQVVDVTGLVLLEHCCDSDPDPISPDKLQPSMADWAQSTN